MANDGRFQLDEQHYGFFDGELPADILVEFPIAMPDVEPSHRDSDIESEEDYTDVDWMFEPDLSIVLQVTVAATIIMLLLVTIASLS